AFIPAAKTIFPDFTINQLARMDDFAFNPGSTTMVVPRAGAIAFAAFIPIKIFGTVALPSNPAKEIGFRDMNGSQMRELQELLHVVLGGAHVQEVTSQQVTIATLSDCSPQNFADNSGKFKCSVTGANLHLTEKAEFQSLDDSNNPV